MKKLIYLFLATGLLAACGQPKSPSAAPELQNRQDSLSWAMGESMAQTLQGMQVLGLDNEVVIQSLRHSLDGSEQPMSDEVVQDLLNQMMFELQVQRRREANTQQAEADKQQAEYFAQLTKERPGVKQHPSGFYYEQVKAGKGPVAKYAQRVLFDYRSFLMFSGEAFDQTYGRREPIVHTVGKPMFQGLIDALQLMNAGSIYRFYFPYQTAFGAQGSGNIPGFTPFIYEVELHEIYND